ARRRLRPDRPVELPADDDDREARPGPRGRLHDRAEARLGDAALGAADGGARDRGRLPARGDQRRAGARGAGGGPQRAAPGGREIMRLASDGIKRLILELGGKSPNIVFADANLEDAIPSSVWAIYYSAGQSCEARSRVLVERSLYDDFVSRFAEAASSLKVGDPLEAESQVGSLISEEHRERVHGYVEAGREEGAEVVTGGEPADGKGAFYPPTVVAQVDNSIRVD